MLLTWKTVLRKKLIQSTQLCQANSISPKNAHFEKDFPKNSQKRLKENSNKKNSNTLPFPFAFYQRPFLPAPTNDANSVSVSNTDWPADASTYCALSEELSKWWIYLCINNVSSLFKCFLRVIPHDNFFLPSKSTYIRKENCSLKTSPEKLGFPRLQSTA